MTQTTELRLKHYQRLIEISRDLVSTLELNKLLQRIINAAVEMSGSEAASILFFDESNRQLRFQVATNMTELDIHRLVVPLEGSIAGWVLEHQETAVIADVHNDPRFCDQVEKTTQVTSRSMVAIPLTHKGKPLGVLEAINKQTGEFSGEDVEILEVLSTQAAVAIENARLFLQSDLISELVHEIRTPLASLDTAAYLLQRPDLPSNQRDTLITTIRQETRRLSEMAGSFLDLARLESGRASFQITPVDLNALIGNCSQTVRPLAEQHQVRLSIQVEPDLPQLMTDADKITQVLLNLLSNAIKYNRPGGEVSLQASLVNGEVAVEVTDTGLGIPQEALPHVFEKFYRVQGSEKSAVGTGLGLSICKRIVESTGGRIEATSLLGQGSQFTVFLPVVHSI